MPLDTEKPNLAKTNRNIFVRLAEKCRFQVKEKSAPPVMKQHSERNCLVLHVKESDSVLKLCRLDGKRMGVPLRSMLFYYENSKGLVAIRWRHDCADTTFNLSVSEFEQLIDSTVNKSSEE